MESIELTRLKRKPDIITAKIEKTKGMIFTKEELSIVIPSRYINSSLASLGSSVVTTAIFAIIDEDHNYGVISLPISMELTPYKISNVTVDSVEYILLSFAKDSVLCPNTNCVVSSSFLYNLFDEFYIKGNVPFYISYEDLAVLFSSANEYAGSKLGNNQLAYEILTATITRTTENKNILYKERPDCKDFTYIGLNDRYYAFDNTGAKLVGGYMAEGISNAMVSPEKETTNLTKVLRS